MNNKSSYIVGALAVVALVVAIVAANTKPSQVAGLNGSQGAQGPQGERGAMGPQGPAGRDGVNGSSGKVGAIPTLDGVDYPFVTINGLRKYYYSQQITATSSAFCSIKNPFNATSTLVSYSVQINSLGGINTTNAFDLSTSTTQYASSTPGYIASYVIPATGGFYSVTWGASGTTTTSRIVGLSPTNTLGGINNGVSDNVIRPSEYLNVRIGTTTPGTFAAGYLSGTCSGVIQKL